MADVDPSDSKLSTTEIAMRFDLRFLRLDAVLVNGSFDYFRASDLARDIDSRGLNVLNNVNTSEFLRLEQS